MDGWVILGQMVVGLFAFIGFAWVLVQCVKGLSR
jgi:hypothetical protein